MSQFMQKCDFTLLLERGDDWYNLVSWIEDVWNNLFIITLRTKSNIDWWAVVVAQW